MPGLSDTLDTLLRLGAEIEAAVDVDDWALVADLIEQRTKAVQRLPDDDAPVTDNLPQGVQEKLEALTSQNESLMEQLQTRQDDLEDELAQIGDLRHAQDSYENNSVEGGVLPDELAG